MRRELLINAAAYKEMRIVMGDRYVKEQQMKIYESLNEEELKHLTPFMAQQAIFEFVTSKEYKEKAKEKLKELKTKLEEMLNDVAKISNEANEKIKEDTTIEVVEDLIRITCNGAKFILAYPKTILEFDKTIETLNHYLPFIEKHDNIYELSEDVEKLFKTGELIDLGDDPDSIH